MGVSKDIIELLKALSRFHLDCGELHHNKNEYHKADEPCPVVAWIKELIERER